jgi:secreted trypsin-like serine protease
MQPAAKFAALLLVIGTVSEAPAGDNWARDEVRRQEAAVFARALRLPPDNLTALAIEPKVIGGVKAPPNKWPFQAALLLASESDNFLAQFCGGSVIDEEFILTAAHCAVIETAPNLHVLTGTQSLRNGGTRRQVRRIRIHPAYNPSNFDYDIALVQLKDKITDIAPGNMPIIISREKEPIFAEGGTQSFVAGWGDTTGKETFPYALRHVAVPIVSRERCNSAKSYDGRITTRMLCAGLARGGKDSCVGDSGGPLVVTTKSGRRRIQAGIVSWGNGCAEPNFYGVYTRLAVLENWIGAHMAAMRASAASALACEISGQTSSPACRRAAKDEAEREMAAYLDTIKRKGTPAQAQSAAAAQRAWAQALGGICAFEAAMNGNLEREDCVAKQARKRADTLAGQLSDLSR